MNASAFLPRCRFGPNVFTCRLHANAPLTEHYTAHNLHSRLLCVCAAATAGVMAGMASAKLGVHTGSWGLLVQFTSERSKRAGSKGSSSEAWAGSACLSDRKTGTLSLTTKRHGAGPGKKGCCWNQMARRGKEHSGRVWREALAPLHPREGRSVQDVGPVGRWRQLRSGPAQPPAWRCTPRPTAGWWAAAAAGWAGREGCAVGAAAPPLTQRGAKGCGR